MDDELTTVSPRPSAASLGSDHLGISAPGGQCRRRCYSPATLRRRDLDASVRRPLGRARPPARAAAAARTARPAVRARGGEAGSGKSRLVREFAAEAEAAGALVLYGACDAVVRAPYGPFAEALGPLSATSPHLRAGSADPRVDPDTERHRLHTAVAGLLARATADRPALLVLEDVHWADAPTLLLLRHLARVPAARRLCLLGHLPRHRGRGAGGAGRGARRPAPATTSSACGSRGCPGRRWRSSSGAPAAPRSTRAAALAARSATSPRATRSSCASCGGRCSRPGRSSSTATAGPDPPLARGARQPRGRARGRRAPPRPPCRR